jgi:CheY-like chemotaxis protein
MSSRNTVFLPDLTRTCSGEAWVKELEASSYLGVPIFGIDGKVAGVISVIGGGNRAFNEEEEWWLRIAARMVGDSFAYKNLGREMRDLERVLHPNQEDDSAEEATAPEVRQPTLLVVDDDRQVNDFITDFLKMEGYNVESAFNGVQAVETFHPEKHSLVISDVAMPLMNGWELTAALRVRAPSLPIVLVSGYSTGEVNKDYLAKQGVSAVLRKPLNLAELSRLVNRLVPL